MALTFRYMLTKIKRRKPQAFGVLFLTSLSFLHFIWIPAIYGAYNEPCYLSENKLNQLRHLILTSAQLLEKHNRTYWLDFGTLLGCVKFGDVLPWDGDADISLIRDTSVDSDPLNSDFAKYGISRNRLVATINNTQLDYFSWDVKNETWNGRPERIIKVYYPQRIVDSDNFLVRYEHEREKLPLSWIIPTKKLKFFGEQVAVPNKYEEVLQARYPLTYKYASIHTPYKWKCWIPCWFDGRNCRKY